MYHFNMKKGTFMKSKSKTNHIMIHLLIALLPIICFSFYKNGIIPYLNNKITIFQMIYPLIFIIVPTFITFLVEFIFAKFCLNKKNQELKEYISNSYSIFPGLFLGLILPLNTPISIVILGAVVASLIGKMLFGGFGYNLFNPALVGRLFIISTYAMVIANNGGYLNAYEIDTISSSTPLSNIVEGIGTYDTLVKPYGSLLDFFIGTIPGSMGETSALLCLIGFIYLTITKVIKWRIPVMYILTVFIMTFVIGISNNVGIWYPLFEILSGGLFFGAVFMATDPVTSPITKVGQIVYGICLGILTVVFRYLTSYPEGVLTSILTMNMFVILIDKLGINIKNSIKKFILLISVMTFISIVISLGISTKYNKEEIDNNYKIISKKQVDNQVIYNVSQKGYSGDITAEVIIENEKVISLNIINQSDSFFDKVNKENYIDKLISNQNDLTNLDTVSGATISSTALKKLMINTLKDYKNNKDEVIEGDIEKPVDFKIVDKKTEQNKVTYIVTKKGFSSTLKLKFVITNNTITNIDVLEQNDSYYDVVSKSNYLKYLIKNQNDLDNLDTVSGATISSTAIKEALIKVLEDYKEGKNE